MVPWAVHLTTPHGLMLPEAHHLRITQAVSRAGKGRLFLSFPDTGQSVLLCDSRKCNLSVAFSTGVLAKAPALVSEEEVESEGECSCASSWDVTGDIDLNENRPDRWQLRV